MKAHDKIHSLDTFKPFAGVMASAGFVLGPQDFVIFFPQGKWTPQVYGIPAYSESYKQFDSLINKQGSLWWAMKAKPVVMDESVINSDVKQIKGMGYQAEPPAAPHYMNLDSIAASPGAGGTLFAFTGTREHGTGNSAVQESRVFFFLQSKYLGADSNQDHGQVWNLYLRDKTKFR